MNGKSYVFKIIRNHVRSCGGLITLDELINDYRISFGCDLPYDEFGYSCPVDLLTHVPGLTVVNVDGQYHLRTTNGNNGAATPSADTSHTGTSRSSNSSSSSSSNSTDALTGLLADRMSALSVETNNDLLVVTNSNATNSRKVTMKSGGNAYVRKNVAGIGTGTKRLEPDPNPEQPSLRRYSGCSRTSFRSVDEYRDSSPFAYGSCSAGSSEYFPSGDVDLLSSPFDNDTVDLSSYSRRFQPPYEQPQNRHHSPSRYPPNNNYVSLSSLYDSSLDCRPYDPLSSFSSNGYHPAAARSPSNVAYQSYGGENGSTPTATAYPPNLTRSKGDTAATPRLPVATTEQVVKRLVTLINAYGRKSSSDAIERGYLESYSEPLPQRWLTLLVESNLVYVENLNAKVMLYPNRSFGTAAPTKSDLPNIDLPDQVPWLVRILAASSPSSVWFRLNENDLECRYQILTHALQKHYEQFECDGGGGGDCGGSGVSNSDVPATTSAAATAAVSSVRVDDLFATRLKGKVMRVRVLACEGDIVTCLAIDEGIMRMLPVKNLINLDEKFTNVPQLALQGSMVDVCAAKVCPYVQRKLQQMISDVDASIIVERLDDKGRMLINVFVTKGVRTTNVNEYLLNVIENELSLPPFELNAMYDVVLLAVEEDVARVQVMSPCYDLLQRTLKQSKEFIERAERGHRLFAKSASDVRHNELYLAKYVDGSWQRILLERFIGVTQVAVVFVDFGCVRAVDVSNIVCCGSGDGDLPDILTHIPPQAVHVNVVKPDLFVLNYMNKTLNTNMFAMKIVQRHPQLFVEMFLKLAEDRATTTNRDSGTNSLNADDLFQTFI